MPKGRYELFHILLHVVRVKARFYEPECTAEEMQQRAADAQAGLAQAEAQTSQMLPDKNRNQWQRVL